MERRPSRRPRQYHAQRHLPWARSRMWSRRKSWACGAWTWPAVELNISGLTCDGQRSVGEDADITRHEADLRCREGVDLRATCIEHIDAHLRIASRGDHVAPWSQRAAFPIPAGSSAAGPDGSTVGAHALDPGRGAEEVQQNIARRILRVSGARQQDQNEPRERRPRAQSPRESAVRTRSECAPCSHGNLHDLG